MSEELKAGEFKVKDKCPKCGSTLMIKYLFRETEDIPIIEAIWVECEECGYKSPFWGRLK